MKEIYRTSIHEFAMHKTTTGELTGIPNKIDIGDRIP